MKEFMQALHDFLTKDRPEKEEIKVVCPKCGYSLQPYRRGTHILKYRCTNCDYEV